MSAMSSQHHQGFAFWNTNNSRLDVVHCLSGIISNFVEDNLTACLLIGAHLSPTGNTRDWVKPGISKMKCWVNFKRTIAVELERTCEEEKRKSTDVDDITANSQRQEFSHDTLMHMLPELCAKPGRSSDGFLCVGTQKALWHVQYCYNPYVRLCWTCHKPIELLHGYSPSSLSEGHAWTAASCPGSPRVLVELISFALYTWFSRLLSAIAVCIAQLLKLILKELFKFCLDS
ncbi:hypothetical protein Pelo_824 [Pelomyxa schiedti]|nr:hypothetical protein Pelo_824 [Pelomyxa schiedti]